jgi:Fe-S-cluster containining protein
MNDNMTPVSSGTRFNFLCAPSVSCFNECCRDLNQFLTPYDILRMKIRLGMTSTDFLARYCQFHTGPESGLPIVTLKPVDGAGLKCPFVTPEGCRIYEDRPTSCRMYPLARAVSRNRETGAISEYYMLMKEPHCRGFEQESTQTVKEWILRQGLPTYNSLNDLMMDVISLKNALVPGSLPLSTRHLFHMACYDLDNFRPHLFKKGIVDHSVMDPEMMESAKSDNVSLLKIGIEAVKQALLGSRH